MFCYQCEQTDRTPSPAGSNLLSHGCSSAKGNCGKDATTAALQDVLVHVDLGIGQYAQKLRELGAPDPRYAAHAAFDMFTTLTNVNFNATRFMQLIAEAAEVRDRARKTTRPPPAPPAAEPETSPEQPSSCRQSRSRGRRVGQAVGVDADPTPRRGRHRPAQPQLLRPQGGVPPPTSRPRPRVSQMTRPTPVSRTGWRSWRPALRTSRRCSATRLELGTVNLAVMAMLDGANTGSFGNPVPTGVRVTPVAGKAILVSGHDLHDLDKILKATEGTGINVYTHGELLPAHGYPELQSTPTSRATTAAPGRTSSATSPPSRVRSS